MLRSCRPAVDRVQLPACGVWCRRDGGCGGSKLWCEIETATPLRFRMVARGGKLDGNSFKEGEAMCDYSLAGIPSRLAAEKELLTVYRFSTGALGLTSPNASWWRFWSKQTPAVCVP